MVFQPEAETYFRELLQQQPKDRWERFRRNKLLHQYGDFLGYVLLGGDPDLQKEVQPLLPLAESNFFQPDRNDRGFDDSPGSAISTSN